MEISKAIATGIVYIAQGAAFGLAIAGLFSPIYIILWIFERGEK